jgi:amino acid adenylation domain-containing protein
MDSQKLIHPRSTEETVRLTERQAVERIIFQQLEIMRQQLEVLHTARGNGCMQAQATALPGALPDILAPDVPERRERKLETPLAHAMTVEYATCGEVLETTSHAETGRRPNLASARENLSLSSESGLKRTHFPLTEAQQEVWLASKLSDTASCAFNESTVFRFRGNFDTEAMIAAFRRIVQRHEALRTIFDPAGETQYIHSSIEFEIPIFDYADMADGHRQEKISALLAESIRNPFDLERGPLFRAQIIKLSGKDHMMVVTAHHAVCDGRSFDVMVRDLSSTYNVLCEGRPDERPLPDMQFSEYAIRQEKSKDGPEVLIAEKYWLQQFTDSIPVLELPSDHQRPSVKSYQGARAAQVLNDTSYSQIKKLGAKQGATLFSTLLAAFSILIYRLTGQSELVVGMFAAGHSVRGSRDLVGHCTNLLPLRVNLNGRESFLELLARIKTIVLDAYDHQGITFGSLIRRFDIKWDPSRTPLVSVLFNIDPAIHGMKFKGLEMEYSANPRCAFQFDMGFNLTAYEKKLICECDYTTDLFDASTIKRWLGHYQALIDNIVENPDQLIEKFPLLTDSERYQIISTWNDTDVKYPKESSVNELFEFQAARVPDAVAVVDQNKTISYNVLDKRSNQLAHFLRSIGVKTETFIGVFMERSIESIVVLLGIMKAGCAYLPLDPTFPKDRIGFMLEDSAAPIILTQTALMDWLPAHQAKAVDFDKDWDIIASYSDHLPEKYAHSSNLAYLMYTSGSTGKPKGVQILHGAVVNFLLSMQQKPGYSEKDILLSVTTLSFDISVLEVFLPLVTGGCTVLVSHEVASDGKLLSESILRHRPTVMQATPVTWRIMLESGWRNDGKFKGLIGGEQVPSDLCDRLLKQGVELWNMYGPTETTIWSTIKQLTLSQDKISIGKPIANTSIYVLDQNLSPVPIGVVGELHIGGDGLARGYLNRADLTAEKFIRNSFSLDPNSRIYKTGDLARYLPDGNLECLGRTDFQAKVRGFRVEPEEIESILNRNAFVKQSAVVVRPDFLDVNQIVAYIVPINGSIPSIPDLRQYLRETLPEYMVPSRFFFLETMPMTPNGKINRKGLPELQDQRDSDLEKSFVASNDSLEMQLTQVWESILGVKPIGIKDNFFEIGGHSLLAARLFARIDKLMGMNLPLATLFQAPTIELLSKIIRDRNWRPSWSSLVPIRAGGSKPPLFFVHGAGGNVLLYRELASHLGSEQPFYGLQSHGLDGKKPYLTRIEEMATHYIREMRSLQPEGPYYLGGYCLGGAVALEVAQQLSEQGQKVALLSMVETYNHHSGNGVLPFYYDILHPLQNMKFHWDNLWVLALSDKMIFLSKKTRTAIERMKLSSVIAFSQFARKLRLPIGEKYNHINLTKINDLAHLEYLPKPYNGRIILFRPKKHYAGYNKEDFGWGEVAQGGVEVHTLPVSPRGTLVEPFVRELAQELNHCIEKRGSLREEIL